jgi:lysophospholipase L1-like esterase
MSSRSTRRGPTHRTRSGVAVVGAATLAALVLAELALRASGFSFEPYPTFYPDGVARGAAAGTFAADPDLLWVSSDYRPQLAAARSNPPKLLLLGDSCTAWGDYGERLAALVAARGGNLSCAKFAVGGWSTFQGLGALRRDLLPLGPEVVVIYFGWNDHWTRFGLPDAVAARSSRAWSRFSGSRLVQLGLKLRIALAANPGEAPPRVSPAEFRENLRTMTRLCRERGAVPILVTAASAHEPGREPAFLAEEGYLADLGTLVPLHREYVAIVREVAVAEGAILCDAERELPGPPLRERFFRRDGIHLDDAGNDALARILLDALERHDLLQAVLP